MDAAIVSFFSAVEEHREICYWFVIAGLQGSIDTFTRTSKGTIGGRKLSSMLSLRRRDGETLSLTHLKVNIKTLQSPKNRILHLCSSTIALGITEYFGVRWLWHWPACGSRCASRKTKTIISFLLASLFLASSRVLGICWHVQVFVYTFSGRRARIVQVHFNGTRLVVRPTKWMDFEEENTDNVRLMLRWMMGTPIGDTSFRSLKMYQELESSTEEFQ